MKKNRHRLLLRSLFKRRDPRRKIKSQIKLQYGLLEKICLLAGDLVDVVDDGTYKIYKDHVQTGAGSVLGPNFARELDFVFEKSWDNSETLGSFPDQSTGAGSNLFSAKQAYLADQKVSSELSANNIPTYTEQLLKNTGKLATDVGWAVATDPSVQFYAVATTACVIGNIFTAATATPICAGLGTKLFTSVAATAAIGILEHAGPTAIDNLPVDDSVKRDLTQLKDAVLVSHDVYQILDFNSSRQNLKTIMQSDDFVDILFDGGELISEAAGELANLENHVTAAFQSTDAWTSELVILSTQHHIASTEMKIIAGTASEILQSRDLTSQEARSLGAYFDNETLLRTYADLPANQLEMLVQKVEFPIDDVKFYDGRLEIRGSADRDVVDIGTSPVNSGLTVVSVNGAARLTILTSDVEEIYVYTGEGNDHIANRTGLNMTAYGGNDHDTIIGGWGSDLIIGGNGGDYLYGRDGDDTINGGRGDDEIRGGAGIDTLAGGVSGNDVVIDDHQLVSLKSKLELEGIHPAPLGNVPGLTDVDVNKLSIPLGEYLVFTPIGIDANGGVISRAETWLFGNGGELLGYDVSVSDGLSVSFNSDVFGGEGTYQTINRVVNENGTASNWVQKTITVTSQENNNPTIGGFSLYPDVALQSQSITGGLSSVHNVVSADVFVDLNHNGIEEIGELFATINASSNWEFSIDANSIPADLYDVIAIGYASGGMESNSLTTTLKVLVDPNDKPQIESVVRLSKNDLTDPEFFVTFDRSMNEQSVENPSHWKFEVDGVAVSIDSMIYESYSLSVTIAVNGGSRLEEGDYELTVDSNEVKSETGLPLRGHLDFAASGNTDSTSRISIRRGQGDRTFRGLADVFTPSRIPEELSAVDLNNDGFNDLVSYDNSGRILTFIGNGDGSFQPLVEYNTGFSSLISVTTGDITRDGFPEVIFADLFSTITVLENDGSGGFGNPITISTPARTKDVVTGDFDQMNGIDVAIADEAGVHVFYNQGNGQLGSAFAALTGSARDISVAHVDQDGFLDIVVTSSVTRSITVLYGKDSGQFDSVLAASGFSSPRYSTAIDVTTDGITDIVFADDHTREIVVLQQTAPRNFNESPRIALDERPTSLTAGDIDLDNTTDLLIGFQRESFVSTLGMLPGEFGQFGQFERITSGLFGNPSVNSVVLAELDARTIVSSFSVTDAAVEASNVFYNNSYFDRNTPQLNDDDDDAIDHTKTPLHCGESASFSNYTSFAGGINGVMFDIRNLRSVDSLGINDFEFRFGNNDSPDQWQLAAPASKFSIRENGGENGSDRVSLAWENNTIQNGWLQVTIKSNANTGLAEPYKVFWGNAIGETGNSSMDAFVDGTDIVGVRDNFRNFLDPAMVDNRHDHNKDHFVDGTDLVISRDNSTNFLNSLNLIDISCGSGFLPVFVMGASDMSFQTRRFKSGIGIAQDYIDFPNLLTPRELVLSGAIKNPYLFSTLNPGFEYIDAETPTIKNVDVFFENNFDKELEFVVETFA